MDDVSKRRGGKQSPDIGKVKVLEEMFKNLDCETIRCVMMECGNDEEIAIERLLEMSDGFECQTFEVPQKPKSSMADIASCLARTGLSQQPAQASNVKSNGVVKKEPQIIPDSLTNEIDQHDRVMIMMRGVSGSGKSTLAKKLEQFYISRRSVVIFSADSFFQINGKYRFEPDRLPEAHDWCKRSVKSSCVKKVSIIIVDNTNLLPWEMDPYASLAAQYNYYLMFVEPDTDWKYSAKFCTLKNCHGISMDNIERMLARFNRSITADQLMQKYIRKPVNSSSTTSTDWEMPVWQEAEVPEILVTPASPKIFRNCGVQTCLKDFALLESAQDDSFIFDPSSDDEESDESEEEFELVPKLSIKLEKGTEIPCFGQNIEESLRELKVMFPNLEERTLLEVLKSCEDDMEWAANLLMSCDPDMKASDEWNYADIPTRPKSEFKFALEPNFARDLLRTFGDIDGPALENTEITLGYELASSIYQVWKKTVEQKSPKQEYKSSEVSATSPVPSSEFKEIMDLEQAVQNSLQDVKDQEKISVREAVHRRYPGVAMEILENILASNGYELQPTLEVLRANEIAKSRLIKESVSKSQALHSPMRLPGAFLEAKFNGIVKSIGKSSSTSRSCVEDARTSITELYRKQDEYRRRAKEYFSAKKYSVASFYSQEAIRCSTKASMINVQSVTAITNSLDLHLLKVNDALEALKRFLDLKQQQLANSRDKKLVVDIITGWGSHGTAPKIKPVVLDYLRKINAE